jgi:hypothetical protein
MPLAFSSAKVLRQPAVWKASALSVRTSSNPGHLDHLPRWEMPLHFPHFYLDFHAPFELIL